MKTEREIFEAYFKTVWKGIDLIQTVGEDFAFKVLDSKYVEDIVEEHWRTWQASASRKGYKLVLLDHMSVIRDALVIACDSGKNYQRYEDSLNYIHKTMMGASE